MHTVAINGLLAGVRPVNWYAGWLLLLGAFAVGAGIGLFIHRDDFWGGYSTYRRRMARLGHIALAALGLLNLLFSLAPAPDPGIPESQVAAACLVAGGLAMPSVCFLSAWKKTFRHLFAIPVGALLLAVALILWSGRGP